jgi:hypothetical protein
MPRIIIEAVPQNQMRPPYDQDERAGDWYTDANGDTIIRTTGTDLADDETFLYALHELVEMRLCQNVGITQEAVDAFDAAYVGDGEPGDADDCPYRQQHRRACLIEFLVADMLGIVGYGTIA